MLGDFPRARQQFVAWHNLIDCAPFLCRVGIQHLLSEDEVPPAHGADHLLPKKIDAVSRSNPEVVVRFILEDCRGSCQNDVTQEDVFRVQQCRAIDRSDERHLDVENVHEDLLAFAIDLVVPAWSEEIEAVGPNLLHEGIPAAGKDYDAASQLTPDNDAIYPERADVAFREGELDQGMALLRQALALNPKNARALQMVANYLSDQGRLDDAIRYASMALDADPNEAHALLIRSETYKRKHQFDLALRDADALAAMPPDRINRQGYLDMYGVKRDFHIMALQNRADIYAEIGNDELAERDLNAAVEYKRSGESLAARGEYLLDRPGRQQAALQDLEEAITLDTRLVHAFYFKGLLLVQLQRYGNAFDAFDRAVAIDPQYDFALRMRALMYRELGQTDLAVRDLEHAMAMSPRVVSMTMRTLRQAGYWNTSEIPNGLTPQLQDAIRACMIDKHCN